MSVGAIRAGRAMVEIFADSSMLSRGLALAQGKLAKFASTLRRLGTAQVVVGATFAAPLAAAVIQYAQLEKRINTVRALTGATAGQMRVLSDQIRKIGASTGMAFTEIADAMGELARAGVRVKDLGAATRVIADFSRAAGIEMGRAANIGVEILTQFGLTMEHLPRVADVLQEMANATVSTVDDLADGFRYAGQSANLFGLSLEQTAAAIAYLQQSGLAASTAGTSLNQMLLQIVQNLDKLEGAIGGLRDANGEFLPFAEILKKLQMFLKDLPGPDRLRFLNEMFDIRGMRGAEGLLKNIEAWLNLTAQAQASMGATARKANEMAKAFVVSFERAQNGVVMLGYAIGEALDKNLRFAFDAIGRTTMALSEFVKKNQEAVQTVANVAAALVASGVAFFGAGLSIQLALFSLDGFIKLAGGVVGAVVAPFKSVAAVVSTVMGRIASSLGRVVLVASTFGASFVRLAVVPARMAILGLGGVINGLAGAAIAMRFAFVAAGAGIASTVSLIAAGLTATLNASGSAIHSIALLTQAALAMNRVVMVSLASFATSMAAVGAASLPALGSLAGAAAIAGAAIIALGVGFAVATRVATQFGRIIFGLADALGQGLPKIWDAFAARAASVWPEIVATAKTGWSGVWAAIESGDLSLAWRVFVDAAHAAFAQVMMIIGPAVDDAAEILFGIGRALYNGLQWAVTQASDLFTELRHLAAPAFTFISESAEAAFSMFGDSMSGMRDLFGQLGEYAEEGGNRIYEALSAGDIVAAWAAGITAIRKMLIDLASWYDQNIGSKIRMVGAEFGSSGARNEMLQRHRAAHGREFSMRTAELSLQPQTMEELKRARDDLMATRGGTEAQRAAIDEAFRHRRDVLRQSGVMSPEEREADRQRQIDAAEADFKKGEKDRQERRKKNAEDRRAAADKAAARGASSASAAQEARRNRAIEQGIDSATTPAELDKQQQAINARVRERESTEKVQSEYGHDPDGVLQFRLADFRDTRDTAVSSVASMQHTLADFVGDGTISEEHANVYNDIIAEFEKKVASATNAAEIAAAKADMWEAAANAAEGFGASGVPGEGELVDIKDARWRANERREDFAAATAAMDEARAVDDKDRMIVAADEREKAAKARREGDHAKAATHEENATRLEQTLDLGEQASMQARLDAKRAELQKQEELRLGKGKAAAAGQREAQDKRLDAIGAFQNSAFDRMGYSSNLAERTAKAAEDTARGVGRLVVMANQGGVFIG